MRESVPTSFTKGESLAWTKCFSDHPASDGWVVTYYFRGAGNGFDAAGTASGDEFTFTVPATNTEGLTAGKYYFQAFAELSAERVLVDSGETDVLAGFLGLDTSEAFDGRSEFKKILDAIDARLKGDISKGVMEYAIGDRQLKNYSLKELTDLRTVYGKLYSQELRAKKGGNILKNHYINFKNPR